MGVRSVTSLLCPHMTSAALASVTDVVGGREDNEEPEEGDSEGEDTDGEEEAMEEGEGESDKGESASDSEEEGADDDEGKEQEVDQDFRNKVKAALGDAGVVSDNEDAASIDMDDLEDEDMDRMDAALAKVFKKLLGGKKNWLEEKQEKLDAVAKMHFKARALDIIDVFLSHSPGMEQSLSLVMPLIRAMESASKQKNYEPLQDRLKGSIKKLAGLKKLHTTPGKEESLDYLPELMTSLVELANSGSPMVATQLAQENLFGRICVMVFKCGTNPGQSCRDQMWEIYFKALDDFFSKSHCQLPQFFFINTLQAAANTEMEKKLADKLTGLTFSPKLRGYKKSQGVHMLVALARLQGQKSEAEGKAAVMDDGLLEGVTAELIACAVSTKDKKPRYLIELLTLVSVVAGGKGREGWNPPQGLLDSLNQVREVMPNNRKFRDVKKTFNKTCVPLGIPAITAGATNADQSGPHGNGSAPATPNGVAPEANGVLSADGEGTPTPAKKKKNKKSKSKEAQQKRKEQKINEYQGQLEDASIPSFAGLVLNSNLNFATAAEAETEAKPENGEPKASKKANKKAKKAGKGGQEKAAVQNGVVPQEAEIVGRADKKAKLKAEKAEKAAAQNGVAPQEAEIGGKAKNKGKKRKMSEGQEVAVPTVNDDQQPKNPKKIKKKKNA